MANRNFRSTDPLPLFASASILLYVYHRLYFAQRASLAWRFFDGLVMTFGCHVLGVASDHFHDHGSNAVNSFSPVVQILLFGAAALTKLLGLVAVFITGFYFVYCITIAFVDRSGPPDICSAEAKTCLAIVGCEDIASSDSAMAKSATNVLGNFASRAGPNPRLQAAFGINNCFTTPDRDTCRKFRGRAEKLLYFEDTKWAKLAASIEQVVVAKMRTSEPRLSLFEVVQMISMKSVLKPLFEFDVNRNDVDHNIGELAKDVNAQWLRSKGSFNPYVEPSWGFDGQSKLQDNPLKFILPGYETMWRVVLRCYIELTVRSHANAPIWRQVLQDFLDVPTPSRLDAVSDAETGTSGTSACQVAQETLRLYVSTRRVYREHETADRRMIKFVAADVEACHRNPVTWAPDPLNFRPERWNGKETKDQEDLIFMPFSTHSFACPAKGRYQGKLPFGLSLIALLVGALAQHTVGEWKLVGELPEAGMPLDTDREAYSDLWLERVERPGDQMVQGGRGEPAESDDHHVERAESKQQEC